MADDHHDLVVVGSGPDGASLAHRPAPSGKPILIRERGDYLPRETQNRGSSKVFVHDRHQARETWYTAQGRAFEPGLHRCVGGDSKVHGAAPLRLRERDFGELAHADGVSPAWPLACADFAPWYDEAERPFHVHSQRGEDPNLRVAAHIAECLGVARP